MDPIRRQLEWLDGQTDSGPALLRWASMHPMIFPAIGLMVGIAVQYLRPIPYGLWLLTAAIFLAGSIVVFLRNPRRQMEILSIACALLCVCVGGLRLIAFWQPNPNDIRHFVGDEKSIASVRGRVVGEPFTADKDSWVFGRFAFSGAGSTLYLRLSEGLTAAGWQPISGTIRVDCGETIEHIHGGDRIELSARISRLNGPMNPGQYDLKKALSRRGIFLAASVKSAQGVRVLSAPADRWLSAGLLRLQQIANSALVDDSMLGQPAEAMVAALVLGQTRQIDPAVYEAFRRTGLAHFICLSGMQMAILAGFLWKLGRAVQLNKRGRAAVTLAISILYILIVPPNPATTRAGVICWFFCVAVLVRRVPDSKNTLALAAVVMLLFRPTDLFNISWQLSFSTVAGILLFDKSMRNRLLALTTDRWAAFAQARSPAWQRWLLYDGPTAAILMLSMGLSAWLAGSGVMLYHFGTITPWATAFTVLVNPLVLGITVLGFLKILIIAWLPSVSMVLGVIVAALSDTMTWATVVLSKIPLCQISIGQVGIKWIAVLYCLMMAIAWWPMRWGGWRFLRPSLALAIVLLLSILHGRRSPSDTLEMTCLAVGPGQAIVLRLPGGQTWLIDAGSQTSPNIGQRIVLPFLRQAGIDRVNAVILSHADTDHFNGLPEIAAVTPIGNIRTNRAFLDEAKTLSGAGFLRQSVEKMGFDLGDIAAADFPAEGATIRPLWPPDQSANPALSDNDQSEVLLVEYAGRRILICSDIEATAQTALLARYPGLKADVVIAPHHGSAATTQSSFLTMLAPSTVIASCAASRTAAAWKPSDPAVTAWYTGRDGAVTTTIKADGALGTIGFVFNSGRESPEGE